MFVLIIVFIIVGGVVKWIRLGVEGWAGGVKLGLLAIRRLITSCQRLLISLTFL